MHRRTNTYRLVPSTLAVLGLSLALAVSGQPQRQSLDASIWREDIRKVKEQVDKQKWKPVRREAKKLAERVIGESWYGPGLRQALAELALYQAVADANLDNDREAIWYWHIAINLDFRMRDRDLSPYGDAAKLLYEFPLRARGETPVSFENRERGPLIRSTNPKSPDTTPPTVLSNAAFAYERQPDFHVEVIIDKKGEMHHPVVVSTYSHPVMTYAALRWIRQLGTFEPGTVEGEATDTVYPLVINFDLKRW